MLKKYLKYIGGDCEFNKNLLSEIYHFGTKSYDNTNNIYDLNNNIIKYNFHIIKTYKDICDNNVIIFNDTVNDIKNIFEKIKIECKIKNIIVYFNYINTDEKFFKKIIEKINEL